MPRALWHFIFNDVLLSFCKIGAARAGPFLVIAQSGDACSFFCRSLSCKGLPVRCVAYLSFFAAAHCVAQAERQILSQGSTQLTKHGEDPVQVLGNLEWFPRMEMPTLKEALSASRGAIGGAPASRFRLENFGDGCISSPLLLGTC